MAAPRGKDVDLIFKKGIELKTIKDFRMDYADGVKAQAIDYAIKNDLVDYIQVGDRVRVIVLTPKTLSYIPNKNSNRTRGILQT